MYKITLKRLCHQYFPEVFVGEHKTKIPCQQLNQLARGTLHLQEDINSSLETSLASKQLSIHVPLGQKYIVGNLVFKLLILEGN